MKHTKARKNRVTWSAGHPRATLGQALIGLALMAAIAVTAWAAMGGPGGAAGASGSPAVVIDRVMSANPGICLPLDGVYYDWLTLTNISDAPVSLAGWKLSDRMDQREAFAFGDVTLQAGQTLMVYCDDAPEGRGGAEVFCGFRLSSAGELLLLSDARGRTVQSLEVPGMNRGDIYALRDGEYLVWPCADLTAHDDLLRAAACPAYDASGVIFSELMPANHATLKDGDGDWSDWIELYNAGPAPVDLTGWSISDDLMKPSKWTFDGLTLQGGEYRVVFLSGKDRADASGELHASFRLASAGETLRLYDPMGRVADWVSYGAAQADMAYVRQADGALLATLSPSPGYENTETGARAALIAGRDRVSQNDLGLYINEVMCSTRGYDWVEIVNESAVEADLSGMGLSDNPAKPRKWRFPEGARIAPGGYALVALEGSEGEKTDQTLPAGTYEANFAASEDETLCLSLADGDVIDSVLLFDQRRGVSYGRAQGHDRYRFFAEATPGAANGERTYARCARQVVFSQAGGVLEQDELTLSLSAEAGMTIYYTTDGSEPSASSKVYDGPLALSKSCVVKAVAWQEDALRSETAVATYVLGAQHGVRMVSLSGKRSELNGSNGTLNTGAKNEGYDVFVEVYEPDGQRILAQACFMKLVGHGSRTNYAQKGFRLTARKAYGKGKFDARLFANRDYDEYNSFLMRASGQDCLQTHMRDSVLSALAADTSVYYQETEVAVLYVNGEYWGVYNMRERADAHSVAQFHGWQDADAVTMVEGSLDRVYASQGDIQPYYDMLRFARHNDLSKAENLEKLRELVDIENYLDYVAMEMYTCNQDLNNVRCYRSEEGDGRFRWVLFDLDLSYQVDANSPARWLDSGGVGSITAQDNTLFIELMKSPAMRDYFLRRMGQLLATTLSADNVVERITERYQLLEPEMAKNCKRWNWSVKTWQNYCKRMASYAKARPNKLIGYLKKTFKLSDAQMEEYFAEAMAVNGYK